MSFHPSQNFFFHSHADHHQDQHFLSGGVPFMMKRSMSFSGVDNKLSEEENGEDGLSDDGYQLGEKKKRLNLEQVKALEKSFELGNKLEPERKSQLARALGLQPRQVAIWFQNRRARWKTKQLEKDYDVLKKQFDALKADNDSLHAQNTKLHAELLALKSCHPSEAAGPVNVKKEIDQGSWSNGSDQNSSDINLEISTTQAINGKSLFPSSLRSTSITQPFQGSSRSTDIQCHKIDHQQLVHQDHESSFCHMFNAIDDQVQPFWPWPPEQHNFH